MRESKDGVELRELKLPLAYEDYLLCIEEVLVHMLNHGFTSNSVKDLIFIYRDLTLFEGVHEHNIELILVFNYLLKCLYFSCT